MNFIWILSPKKNKQKFGEEGGSNDNEHMGSNNNNNNYFLKLGQTHQERNLRLRLYFIEACATCNSLTKINGNLIGETIDLEMLKSTGWTFEECSGPFTLGFYRPNEDLLNQYSSKQLKLENKIDEDLQSINSLYQLDLIKRFDFVSKLQRMSVLVKNAKEDYFKVYCKGSPEKSENYANLKLFLVTIIGCLIHIQIKV